MPAAFQREVLDFVEFLLHKTANEEKDWSEFSLAQAMRGLENGETVEYSDADLRKTPQ